MTYSADIHKLIFLATPQIFQSQLLESMTALRSQLSSVIEREV